MLGQPARRPALQEACEESRLPRKIACLSGWLTKITREHFIEANSRESKESLSGNRIGKENSRVGQASRLPGRRRQPPTTSSMQSLILGPFLSPRSGFGSHLCQSLVVWSSPQ